MNEYSLTCVRESGIHGKGLFAREDIKNKVYLGEYEGPVAKRNGSHVLWVYDDGGVIGRSGKNKLRYLNHRQSSNAEFDGFKLFSTRKIVSGEEITINYGDEWDEVE